MERVVFSNSWKKDLVGNLYSVDSDKIIVMAHGFLSDKSSKGRFNMLAEAFNASGFDALAFDFGGCGESAEESLTAEKELDDLRSAIRFVKSRGYQRIALYGHSLGSLICLRAFTPEIETMVLSGALTGPMQYDWDAFFSEEELSELAEKGYITLQINSDVRGTRVIDKQMLLDFEEINQSELLQRVTCPVLILHGNNEGDPEELQLLENSKRGLRYLSSDSRIEVIEGATHSFMDHMDILKDLADRWFVRHMG